ncbi:MAG TPA: amidohydrolase family protein [Bryobacteraceae bacterium]|jgi:predicted TIM-barrel fold metal-dependent hydrolase|nr:amidohydrolase family protein [Bryobacteraceae bacterium]
MLILDTHAHIYSEDEKAYPPNAKPYRPPGTTGSVANLERVTRANGVAGVCIVQATTFYGWDNRFICDTAARTQKWTAGVCTLDPDEPHSPGLIKHFAEKYGIRALRSYPAKDGKLDSAGVAALWKASSEAGIVVNVLCNRDNEDAFARMLEKFPRQPVVIDHCLNLKAGSDQNDILKALLRLSKYRNAHAKLSFLATGSAEAYPFRDMQGPCKQIIAAFTPDRCIWDSDFPCELWTPKATYAENLRLFTQELNLSEAAKVSILGATARKLYFRDKLG